MEHSLKQSIKNCKQLLNIPEAIKYGTAGYRADASKLQNVICRVSLFAAIKSYTSGKYIGMMLTASHNKSTDNGVKLIDYTGDYIDESSEKQCDKIANSQYENLVEVCLNTVNDTNCSKGQVLGIILGRDTRCSGEQFVKDIKTVLGQMNVPVVDYDYVSTPQLHFFVRQTNLLNTVVSKTSYYTKFLEFLEKYPNPKVVAVDCANGIGFHVLDTFNKIVKRTIYRTVNVQALPNNLITQNNISIPDPKTLNFECGADFILTKQRLPNKCNLNDELIGAFDGDADRFIIFDKNLNIFNGDRQTVIIAKFIKDELKKHDINNLKIGAVLSHYSDSNAIKFIESMNLEVVLANTGVKNFLAASRKFDIGIYFEPNGHGSLTLSEHASNVLNKPSTKMLYEILNLFDPNVGDGFANLVAFGLIFDSHEYFTPNHSKLLAVKVKNKNVFVMADDVTIIEPKSLKQKLEEFNKRGRVFVRPSGTEELVRIFVEAENDKICNELADEVTKTIFDMCDGDDKES